MEAARAHLQEPGAEASGRSPLTVVPSPRTSPLPAMLEEPNVGRTAAIGAVIGLVVMTTLVTLVGLVNNFGFGPSFGLGLFIGLWGGAGSGFMIGATVPLSRYLDAVHAARLEPSGSSDNSQS